ncbi:MAG TPA: DUF4142 domain-containing protein [Paracoccus sp. (in: a-proteobacteria)]|nr:DUF4142 domain-containing protein [Paracoccus sp. (in: a-proteobacteria)]
MRVAVPALALALLSGPGFAQIGNPGFMAPDTRFESPGVPAPDQPNDNDKLFAQLAAEGGLAEVALAELASGKAQASAVGGFARRMVEDHSAANDELAGLAEKSGIPLPDDLNPEHAAMRARLEGLEGAAFDLAYMRGQIVDHQKTAQILIWEINSGQDGDLQRFAAGKLPTILERLQLARGIVDELSGVTGVTPARGAEPEAPDAE